ncbi:MAG: hypothetical protein AAGJ56_09055, partial [Myxococcota bacterium]
MHQRVSRLRANISYANSEAPSVKIAAASFTRRVYSLETIRERQLPAFRTQLERYVQSRRLRDNG